MRKLNTNPNVINSDANYPNGRIRNNTGSGNGTPVNESVYGDIHVNKDKLMDLYGITPNDLPDNEANGYQIIESLRALASKNDFILPLSLNTGVLNVPIKIGFMLENEQVVCKASFDLATETQIKGSDNITLSFTANGSFKANEYVRVVKNASSITIIRLADEISLDSMINNLLYLKKASQSEENLGVIDTKATTPLSNLTAFIRRVNGADTAPYLATASQNGIYPKEHFTIVNALVATRNKGSISSIDFGGEILGTTFSVTGDIISATVVAVNTSTTRIRIVLANSMTNTSYYVRSYVQSLSTDQNFDTALGVPVFKVIDDLTFDFAMKEFLDFLGANQNVQIHFEVVKI